MYTGFYVNTWLNDNELLQGTFPGGEEVAVKRLCRNSGQGLEEFKNEVILIAKLQHRNLVRLLGCCIQREEKILVYEYMEKGTLKSHLYGSDMPPLSWKKRLEICIGAARGLHYLHTGFAKSIIHRVLPEYISRFWWQLFPRS